MIRFLVSIGLSSAIFTSLVVSRNTLAGIPVSENSAQNSLSSVEVVNTRDAQLNRFGKPSIRHEDSTLQFFDSKDELNKYIAHRGSGRKPPTFEESMQKAPPATSDSEVVMLAFNPQKIKGKEAQIDMLIAETLLVSPVKDGSVQPHKCNYYKRVEVKCGYLPGKKVEEFRAKASAIAPGAYYLVNIRRMSNSYGG
jgi:hypothetical protein